ncbi:MAG: selenoneine biosynthesis selenosugar synthase SenB [Burkholderiales bacterium]
MNIVIITPAAAPVLGGNRNTAQRWARLLRELGHRVRIGTAWDSRAADAMIALHARKSHAAIKNFSLAQPAAPLILCLTGTDLYRDIQFDAEAQESMQLATRLIVLQEQGLNELPPQIRARTRVIYQSARLVKSVPPLKSCFEIYVIGHLREEKDPFRCAMALQYLPASSRIVVRQLGQSLSQEMEDEAKQWMQHEPRYQWLGEVSHAAARRRLARSRLLVVSSRMEGGANVISEAVISRVPVLASNIAGNIGMLGKDYAGYFELENERELAKLLHRAESDKIFYRRLKTQCAKRLSLLREKNEKASLRRLLSESLAR